MGGEGDKVAAVVQEAAGDRGAVTPLTDHEWTPAEPPEQPLQPAGMEERVRVARCASARGDREEVGEIAPELERTLGELRHFAGPRSTSCGGSFGSVHRMYA